ncbi:MAG: hypothetical protein AB1451_05135 [Nitrospirota bacterium]
MTAVRWPVVVTVAILAGCASAPVSDTTARSIITSRCGACHGVTLDARCVAGDCAGRSHAIEPRPWTLVLSWMQAMGCPLSASERASLEEYLMSRYPKVSTMEWEPLEPVPAGWNVVALKPFRDRLYAGIEGAGTALRLEGRSWRPVLTTEAYTVYGLVSFRDRLFAGTNQPRAEVWSSADGAQWSHEATLPAEERGVIALGVFGDALYAGTTRGRVYRTTDGRAWSPAGALLSGADNQFPNWVRFLIPFEGSLYAGVEGAGVFRSPDGAAWEMVRFPSEPRVGVRAAVAAGAFLYVGTTTGGAVWRTRDGETWERVLAAGESSGVRGEYVASLVEAAGVLYAAVNGRVQRSSDGSSWHEVGELTPFTVEAMQEFGGALYAGTALPPRAWVYRSPLSAPAERSGPGAPR